MQRRMTIARRIRQRRNALELSQEALAQRVGVGQTTVAAWEKGRNTPKGENLNHLARALGVPNQWLQYGEDGAAGKQVKLRGYVGAGEQVFLMTDDAVDWVPAPPEVEEETEALEIRGNSMWPVYRNGDVIYYEIGRTADPARMIGEECIVELADHQLYIKRVLPGSKAGVYTLASYNGPELPDRAIVSCAPILWVKRRRRR